MRALPEASEMFGRMGELCDEFRPGTYELIAEA